MRSIILIIYVAFLLCSVALSKTTSIQSEAIGINEIYTNPNTYLLASVSEGTVIEGDRNRLFTNVRFQPYHTFALYDESVLFCDNTTEFFNGKHGALVIVYETATHRSYQGVGCHILLGVFEVKGDK